MKKSLLLSLLLLAGVSGSVFAMDEEKDTDTDTTEETVKTDPKQQLHKVYVKGKYLAQMEEQGIKHMTKEEAKQAKVTNDDSDKKGPGVLKKFYTNHKTTSRFLLCAGLVGVGTVGTLLTQKGLQKYRSRGK